MPDADVSSLFLPAQRADVQTIADQSDLFRDCLLNECLSAIPEILLVLNQNRQIVYANTGLANFLGISDPGALHGLRPGEVLDCIHAYEDNGCGCTEFCRQCGAVTAIVSSLNGHRDIQDCRILRKQSGDALDLRVWSKPVQMNGERFVAIAIADIQHEKRRNVLERVFLNDILNTVSGLHGVAEIIQDASLEEVREMRTLLYGLCDTLVEAIRGQRLLLAAENRELQIHPETVYPQVLLRDLMEQYGANEIARGRTLSLICSSDSLEMETDPILLKQVLNHVLRNALEASVMGEVVTLGCDRQHDRICLWIHNPAAIPPDAQLQIFQRSFSTKGAGRGLGTYSIKLLSERYLQGQVSFRSNQTEGTTFFARYPIRLVRHD